MRPFEQDHELARKMGKLGGIAVVKKYGNEYYKEIGKKGGNTVKHERGSTYFSEIGRRGGLAKAANAAKQ